MTPRYRQKVADYNNQLDLLKKRIQAENLQDKTQWPVSSGTGWGGNDEGCKRNGSDSPYLRLWTDGLGQFDGHAWTTATILRQAD